MTTKRGAKTRRRPVSSAGGRLLRKLRKNAARRGKSTWKKTLRRHPALGVVLSITLAALGVLMLTMGLLAENALYFLATALAGLGSAAVARARHLELQRQQQQASRRPTVSTPASEPRTERPAEQAPGGVVRCTETGKPISDCDCGYSRHVATSEGARRYGLPLGTPFGRRAATPSTHRGA